MFSANSTQVGGTDTGPYYLYGSGGNAYYQAGNGFNTAGIGMVLAPFPMNGVAYASVCGGYPNASVFIKSDGTLWTVGLNTANVRGTGTASVYQNPTRITSTADWAKCAATGTVGLAVKTDGTLWGWGAGTYGLNGNILKTEWSVPTQIGALTNWSKVALSIDVASAIKTDGTLWGWGYNGSGCIGDNTRTNRSSPVQIGALTDWADVASGGGGLTSFTLAVKTDGTLWAWGDGGYGQTGFNDRLDRSSPVQVGSSTDWAKVFANYSYSAAIKTDGTLWTWGNNTNGQLGSGTTVTRSSPVQIATNVAWVSFPAAEVTAYVKTTGELFTVGYSSLSNGIQLLSWGVSARSSPVQVASDCAPVGVISASLSQAKATDGWGLLVTKTDGTTLCTNNSGSGVFTAINNAAAAPATITVTPEWATAAMGAVVPNTVAVKSNGTLWTWGANSAGQLGNGGTGTGISPVQVGALTDWLKVATGSQSCAAIKTDGTLWTWGSNSNGQLGLNNLNDKSSPTQVGALSTWAEIAVGNSSPGDNTNGWMLAVKTDGTLWAWGGNFEGTLGTNNTTQRQSPVQVGALTNWAKVAASGIYNSYAIKTDGTLWAWGQNVYGALGNNASGTSKSSPVQIGALTTWSKVIGGYYSAYAIKTDGTLWAWGRNTEGQLGDGTVADKSSPVQIGSSTDWVDVAAYLYGAVAVKSDGTMWSWGQYPLSGSYRANVSSPVQIGNYSGWNNVFSCPRQYNFLALK